MKKVSVYMGGAKNAKDSFLVGRDFPSDAKTEQGCHPGLCRCLVDFGVVLRGSYAAV